jgi:hypothetical protein
MNRGFTQSLMKAILGRNMQLILNVTAFFTVKIRLCWNRRNLEGSGRGVKEVLPP